MTWWHFVFDVASIFVAGAIIGALAVLAWQDRLDSPEDMEARMRMLDEAERSFYEHEGPRQ